MSWVTPSLDWHLSWRRVGWILVLIFVGLPFFAFTIAGGDLPACNLNPFRYAWSKEYRSRKHERWRLQGKWSLVFDTAGLLMTMLLLILAVAMYSVAFYLAYFLVRYQDFPVWFSPS